MKTKKIARQVFQFVRAAWYWLVYVLVWPLIWNYERHRGGNRIPHDGNHWGTILLESKGMQATTTGRGFWE